MTKRILPILLLVLACCTGVARADEPPPADNPLLGVKLDKYQLNREKGDIAVDMGRLFRKDLKEASPSAEASVVDSVRFEIQKEETAKFAHQKQFVIYAYGAIWVILLIFVVGLYARQRQLNAELAELERRVGTEKEVAMGNITSGHFIFIPMVLAIGFVIGFIVGGRAARDAYQMELRREEDRKKAKVDREARRAARAAEDDKQE